MNTAMKPLSLDGVSVGYGDQYVAKDVSFELKSGEIFGFIGLNGEVKTTLIKTILGLREPLSGSVEIFGSRSCTVDVKKNVSYLPEKFVPSWFMKGEEFILFVDDDTKEKSP